VQLTSIKELQGHLKFNCISGKGGLSQKGLFIACFLHCASFSTGGEADRFVAFNIA
jgi:hypothetical protein